MDYGSGWCRFGCTPARRLRIRLELYGKGDWPSNARAGARTYGQGLATLARPPRQN